MKKLSILLLLFTSLHVFAQKKPVKHFKNFKTYSINLNNDSIPDTIRLSSSLNEKDKFNRITISLTGFGKQTFTAKTKWLDVDTAFLRQNKNAINSKWIFFKKAPLNNVILLFGAQEGGGYREEFSMIDIEHNQAKMVFDDNGDKNVELPQKLIDLDNDGRLDFIYRITFQYSETLANGSLGSYSPYFVYTIAEICELNKPLMKAYNQIHYVFAGYQYSEDVSIFYPTNPKLKPHVWKK